MEAPAATATTLLTDVAFGTASKGLATGTVTLSGTQSAKGITFGAASGTITLSGGTLNLPAGGFITLNNNSATTSADDISSVITGGSLLKNGPGALGLSGTNTYTGGTVISQGGIFLRNAAGAGTGTITMGDSASGTGPLILLLSTSRQAIANTIVVSSLASGPVTIGSRSSVGSSGNNNYFNRITLQRDVTFDSNASDRTDYRNITGTGNITITGTGRTIFYTANTFTGDITVNVSAGGSFQIGTQHSGTQTFIPDTASVTVNDVPGSSTTEFQLSCGSEAIDALLGNGTISVNSINSVLTVGTDGGSGDFSGVLKNSGGYTLGLTKTGSGTQKLTGANTYTGATTVTGGTLVVNGSLAATPVSVSAAGTLAGSGTIGGATTLSGTLSPGDSTGLITFAGDLNCNNNSAVNWELPANNDTGRGTIYDAVNVGGNLTISGTSRIHLAFDGANSAVDWTHSFWRTSHSWELCRVTGTRTGSFALGTISPDSNGLVLATLNQGSFALRESCASIWLDYIAADANTNGILDTWEIARFGNANPGANLPNDDADRDGITNIMEFALDTHPLQPGVLPMLVEFVEMADGSHLRATVSRNPAATNLTYTVEVSSDLINWTSVDTIVETNTSTQLIVSDAFSHITATQRFMRLRVTAMP